jgi:hypothetical protein
MHFRSFQKQIRLFRIVDKGFHLQARTYLLCNIDCSVKEYAQ